MVNTDRLLKILLVGLFFSALFFLSSVFYWFYRGRTTSQPIVTPLAGDQPTLEVELKEVPLPQQQYQFLLLGHGDPGHPGGDLADSLMVVSLDFEQQKAALISIPRDTWLTVQLAPDKVEPHKINEVYLTGKKKKDEEFGFQLIKQAVGQVTGLPIHYYVFINFSKFMEAIDALGGIEVEVPVTFHDYFYPVRGKELETCGLSGEQIAALTATMSGFLLERQFPCRYEHLYFQKGITEMDGRTALKFVRSRHSNEHGGDFARAERQQAVILGVKDKLLTLDGWRKAPDFFKRLSGLVKTDLDEEIISQMIKKPLNPETVEVKSLVLSTQNAFVSGRNERGQFILIPQAGADQWDQVRDLVKTMVE